jgi:hypothetical protein
LKKKVWKPISKIWGLAPTADVQRRFGAMLQLLAQQAAPTQQQQNLPQQMMIHFGQSQQEPAQGLLFSAANRVFVDGRICTLAATYLALLQAHYGKTDELVQAIDFGAAVEAAKVEQPTFVYFLKIFLIRI